jgi:hypothetical protein
MDEKPKEYALEPDVITSLIKLEDYVIRYIKSFRSSDGEDLSGYQAQGRITNIIQTTLHDVVLDVSYYDHKGNFVGLDKTGGLFNIDNLDPGCTIPFDIDLDIPENTARCTLNISARELKGFWARWMMGAKKG